LSHRVFRRFVGMYRGILFYLKRPRYNFNEFSNQKFIETDRTDISNMLFSLRFKPIKRLILSCFVSSSIPTFLSGCIEMFVVIWGVLDTISIIFLIKNSLKPLELTFLISIYRHVFKPIKKLILSCLLKAFEFTFKVVSRYFFLSYSVKKKTRNDNN